MDSYLLVKYLHVLAFVYWLGADLGVFLAARYAARPDLALAERRRFLRLTLLLDMGPRSGLILMVPTGITLASRGGWTDLDAAALAMVWISATLWLALTWALYFREGEQGAVAAWRRVDIAVRIVVVAGFTSMAVASLAGYGPVRADWLAFKALLFAGAVSIGLMLRLCLRDWLRGMRLIGSGEDVGLGNGLVAVASRRAERWALLLWLFVALTALLGVVQPGFR